MRMRHGLHCENPSGRGHLEDTWTPAEKARMLLRLLLTPALAYIPKNRIFAASPATVAWTAQRPASHTGPSVSFTPSPSFVAVVRRGGAWCRQQTQPVTEVVLHCVASRGEGRGERQQCRRTSQAGKWGYSGYRLLRVFSPIFPAIFI